MKKSQSEINAKIIISDDGCLYKFILDWKFGESIFLQAPPFYYIPEEFFCQLVIGVMFRPEAVYEQSLYKYQLGFYKAYHYISIPMKSHGKWSMHGQTHGA